MVILISSCSDCAQSFLIWDDIWSRDSEDSSHTHCGQTSGAWKTINRDLVARFLTDVGEWIWHLISFDSPQLRLEGDCSGFPNCTKLAALSLHVLRCLLLYLPSPTHHASSLSELVHGFDVFILDAAGTALFDQDSPLFLKSYHSCSLGLLSSQRASSSSCV